MNSFLRQETATSLPRSTGFLKGKKGHIEVLQTEEIRDALIVKVLKQQSATAHADGPR
jgi:hypothetical protein